MIKKLSKVFILLIGIFLITGCSDQLKEVTYSEFQGMVESKKSFIVVVSQDGCSHCIDYAPRIESILSKNNIEAYDLNITHFSENDYKKFSEKYNFKGTPTTMFFKDGEEEVSSRLTGSVGDSQIKKALKKQGYIK